MATKKRPSFKAGMYLLETLTAGMYNQPLSIYREYIQNAVDSIDSSKTKNEKMKVSIEIDPFDRKIEITDNGEGISGDLAQQILSNIGISKKIDKKLRGFRGIGRLGGIAFSEKVIFKTKAKNETIESVQIWDCRKLNEIISDKKNNSMSLRQLFNKTTIFHQKELTKRTGSYFKVILEGVSSFKNYLFDISRIKNYLSDTGPLPFNYDDFSYGIDIDEFLAKNLSLYGKHEIYLNGETVYKPYKDIINITKGDIDLIEKVELIEITINDKPAAYGWYGLRKDLLGSISKGDKSSGIKVRQGNILIGDSHLLDSCFREPRFNSYVIGEIHIDSEKLIPNSRRDDFVDNEFKSKFYNEVERIIGLPLSKEIRNRSKLASKNPKTGDSQSLNQIKTCNDAASPISQKKLNNAHSNCEHLLELLKKCLECKNINSCTIGATVSEIGRKN